MKTIQRLRICAVAVVYASAFRGGGNAVWNGVQGFSPVLPPHSWVIMSGLESGFSKKEHLKAKVGDNDTDGDVYTELEKKISGRQDNNAMSFLRKIGKVGGAANKNFVNAVGADEGTVGKVAPAEGNGMANLKKAKAAFKECTESGVIDDLSEAFPMTSSGTQWRGISDRVMGGLSNGMIERKEIVTRDVSLGMEEYIMANILEGRVSLDNNGGFIQMATDLAVDPSQSTTVDASNYEGIELTVLHNNKYNNRNSALSQPEPFNVHLRTPDCIQRPSSYRSTFVLSEPEAWETVRVPFSDFVGYGAGAAEVPLNTSTLRRIGIVAIGREIEDVSLALSNLSFY